MTKGQRRLDPEEEIEIIEQVASDIAEFLGGLDSVSITLSRVVNGETQWFGVHHGNIYAARGSMADHIEGIDAAGDKINFEDNDTLE